MNKLLTRQLKQIERLEQKIMNQSENQMLKSTLSPAKDKLESMIPEKLKSVLNTAFYKGFQLVFEKGSPYIEKTYQKDKIKVEYDINNYAFDRELNKQYIKRLDKQSKQSNRINASISVVEGSVLGLLGIGLPDIPLFISVLVKTIYEIALSYGFHYDTEEEKAFILLLLCAAISKDDHQRELNTEVDQLGAKLDQNIVTELEIDVLMKNTAQLLSDALLTAKFVQGIPIIGTIGGIVNYNIHKKIATYARIKYKKRYLLKKMQE